MKLSTLLLFVLVVFGTTSVATTSETETETAAAAAAATAESEATDEVEGSCKATYDSEGNIVEGSGGDEDDDEDDDDDEEDDKPDDFSKYDCNDMNKDCELWAGQGECDANPKVSGTAVL